MSLQLTFTLSDFGHGHTHTHTHTDTYKRVQDHDKEPTVASIHRTSAEDDEDLGIIFILFHPSKVHVALDQV